MRLACVLIGSIAAIASAADARIIEISNSGEISEAQAVNAAVSAAADAAAVCRKTTSRTALQCECSARAEMGRLKSAYDAAVTNHPDWAQPDTTVWWSGTALNFSAIGRALGTCA